jgi:hypothetical protein
MTFKLLYQKRNSNPLAGVQKTNDPKARITDEGLIFEKKKIALLGSVLKQEQQLLALAEPEP